MEKGNNSIYDFLVWRKRMSYTTIQLFSSTIKSVPSCDLGALKPNHTRYFYYWNNFDFS